MTSNLRRCLIFARKLVNINVLRSATPKLAHVQANHYYFDVFYSYLNVCSSYARIERGSYGVHDFKINKVPLFRSKTC